MVRALLSCVAMAVMLDRVVVSVGLDAITEHQLQQELAVTAFLNHEPLRDTAEARRAAAHRLIQQTLIARDMQLARFPEAEASRIDAAVDRIEQEYRGAQTFNEALKNDGLTLAVLRNHIANQLTTLRFIEYRFRPELTISEDELHAEFDRRTASWAREHPGAGKPNFDDSSSTLRSSMIEERTDKALDNWLNQTTAQSRIVYIDPSLQPAK